MTSDDTTITEVVSCCFHKGPFFLVVCEEGNTKASPEVFRSNNNHSNAVDTACLEKETIVDVEDVYANSLLQQPLL